MVTWNEKKEVLRREHFLKVAESDYIRRLHKATIKLHRKGLEDGYDRDEFGIYDAE